MWPEWYSLFSMGLTPKHTMSIRLTAIHVIKKLVLGYQNSRLQATRTMTHI